LAALISQSDNGSNLLRPFTAASKGIVKALDRECWQCCEHPFGFVAAAASLHCAKTRQDDGQKLEPVEQKLVVTPPQKNKPKGQQQSLGF